LAEEITEYNQILQKAESDRNEEKVDLDQIDEDEPLKKPTATGPPKSVYGGQSVARTSAQSFIPTSNLK
jgi:hypothetical protein